MVGREARYHFHRCSLHLALKLAVCCFLWAEGHVSFLPPTGQTMELKELEWPAVQVWSPASQYSQYPVYLATGSTGLGSTGSAQVEGKLNIQNSLWCFRVIGRSGWLANINKELLGIFGAWAALDYGSRLGISCFLAFVLPFEKGFPQSSPVLCPLHSITIIPKSMHVLLLICCLFLTFLVPRNICPAARCLL